MLERSLRVYQFLHRALDFSDAIPTWHDLFVNPGSGNVTRYVQHITIDPGDPSHVYVCFGGLQSDPIYVTSDNGLTWTSASGSGATGLPPAPVRYMSTHPSNASWLFAGTAVGLYSSRDGGNTWAAIGPANVDTWDTRFIPGTSTILLGTHGRGMWTQNEVAVKDVTVSPNPVAPGGSSVGTVDLYGMADSSGLTVFLSANNGAAVPPSVSLTNGQSSANFNIGTAAGSSGTVTITASLYGTNATATLVLAQPLVNFTISPTAEVGGHHATGTVTLAGNAVAPGETVSLSGGDGNVSYPSTVTVPTGSPSANFTISDLIVSVTDRETLTATLGSVSKTATLTITPYPLKTLTFTPSTVIGLHSSTGDVKLAGDAGPTDEVVTLSGGDAFISYPPTVTILAGSTGREFKVLTSAVSTNDVETITATFNSSFVSGTLTITPANVVSLSFSPGSQTGGYSAIGIVTLNGHAGPSGDVVSLSGGDPQISYPSTVTVPAGQTEGKFKILTYPVSSNDVETLKATLGSSYASGNFTVKSAYPISLTFNPNPVNGGTSTTATVTLHGKAGSSGITVSITGGDSSVSYPATITVPAGQTTKTFTVATSAVGSQKTETLTAATVTGSATGSLTINPP